MRRCNNNDNNKRFTSMMCIRSYWQWPPHLVQDFPSTKKTRQQQLVYNFHIRSITRKTATDNKRISSVTQSGRHTIRFEFSGFAHHINNIIITIQVIIHTLNKRMASILVSRIQGCVFRALLDGNNELVARLEKWMPPEFSVVIMLLIQLFK